MHRRLAVLALIALPIAASSGCFASYTPLQGTIPQAAAGPLPRALCVTRQDGSRIILYEAQLSGDTLLGWNEASASTRAAQRTLIRIAVVDVRDLSAQGTNWLASFGTGVGISLLALVVAAGATYQGM